MEIPVFGYILIKLATRCNIHCPYCYWFRDEAVYSKPPLLTLEAEDQFLRVLEEHVTEHRLATFTTLFHGGEPLLFPKKRFVALMEKLCALEQRTGCRIDPIITTNGMLVDTRWCEIFKRYGIGVSVSVDGPQEIHDRNRIYRDGRGTYSEAIRGLKLLQDHGIDPGIIAVCDPASDPDAVMAHFVDTLSVEKFDILPPDFNHDDTPQQIDRYYNRLFATWYRHYAARGVRLRILDGIVQGLAGNAPVTDSCGYGPVHTLTLLTDGALEPLDVLRIRGNASTASQMNVFENTLQDVGRDPVWMEAFAASLSLCETCEACEFLDSCGGGHLAHRWSAQRGYDNPSVYCESWKSIFRNAWTVVAPTLYFEDAAVQAAFPDDGSQPSRQKTSPSNLTAHEL